MYRVATGREHRATADPAAEAAARANHVDTGREHPVTADLAGKVTATTRRGGEHPPTNISK